MEILETIVEETLQQNGATTADLYVRGLAPIIMGCPINNPTNNPGVFDACSTRALLDDVFMMTAAIFSRSAPPVELDIILVPVAVPGEAGRLTKVLALPRPRAVPVSGASEPPAGTVGVDRDWQVAKMLKTKDAIKPFSLVGCSPGCAC